MTDWIGRHEVLLSINHKNYNFRKKEKWLSHEKRGKFALKYWQRRRKHSGYRKNTEARARTRNYNFECDWLIQLNYIFECDWLIELSDNKLSNNNLESELVENRTFLNQSQARKL